MSKFLISIAFTDDNDVDQANHTIKQFGPFSSEAKAEKWANNNLAGKLPDYLEAIVSEIRMDVADFLADLEIWS